LPEILVRLQVLGTPDDFVWQEVWTITNASGQYSLPWTFSQSSLHRLRVSVFAERPRLAANATSVSRPQAEFQIGSTILSSDTKPLGVVPILITLPLESAKYPC
jgi:hypothetical protein